MEKIRILFIDARGDHGGGSKHLSDLIKGLPADQIEVYVASPRGQHYTSVYQSCAKATISIPFRSFSLDTFRELSTFVEDKKIHLTHSHGRAAGLYSRLLARQLHVPALHTFHGIHYDNRNPLTWPGLFFERWLSKFTAHFIHVSPSEQAYALQLKITDKRRSSVIPNGIDVARYEQNRAKRGDMRAQLGIKPHTFVIGCVARFDACKRHEDLIQALSLMQNNHHKTKLILIGDGPEKQKIQALVNSLGINDRVEFLGERDDAPLLYSTFDVFVLPSLAEGLPYTPLEAMASGCPVVLSAVRGNQDILENEQNGLLIPPKNRKKLASAIQRLSNDKVLRARLSEEGIKYVRERFSLEQMQQTYINLYKRLIPHLRFRKVAFVHDWLFHMRGGEKVLESMAEFFPLAPIYTLFLDQSKLSESLQQHLLKASFLNKIPGMKRFYRYLLPIFPFVIRQFNLKGHDLIVSSHHCVAKAIQRDSHSTHICYCHTPMRYAWGFESDYFAQFRFPLRQFIGILMAWLRQWDLKTNDNVDYFIANSFNIRSRISHFYKRSANVIHPPITKPTPERVSSEGAGYLIVSALVPYKRIDIAVEAFNHLGTNLKIIGDGPLLEALKKNAKPNIEFLGWQKDRELGRYYQLCKALIFPTEEDFGMVPVEAMMYGKPVIGLGKGGLLETVKPHGGVSSQDISTGVFFDHQTADALCDAVKRFETLRFDANSIQQHALQFETTNFQKQFKQFVEGIH